MIGCRRQKDLRLDEINLEHIHTWYSVFSWGLNGKYTVFIIYLTLFILNCTYSDISENDLKPNTISIIIYIHFLVQWHTTLPQPNRTTSNGKYKFVKIHILYHNNLRVQINETQTKSTSKRVGFLCWKLISECKVKTGYWHSIEWMRSVGVVCTIDLRGFHFERTLQRFTYTDLNTKALWTGLKRYCLLTKIRRHDNI